MVNLITMIHHINTYRTLYNYDLQLIVMTIQSTILITTMEITCNDNNHKDGNNVINAIAIT